MNSYSKIFIAICFMSLLVSCDKEEPSDNLAKLEYVECKINGEPFRANSNWGCNGQRWDYYPEAYLSIPAGTALISGRDCQTYTAVSIRIDGLEHQTGYLDFLEPAFADTVSPFYRYNDLTLPEAIMYEKLISGSLTINEFEARQNGTGPLGWIEGSFEFVVTDELGNDTIRVTQGRFGLDVPQIF
jgi:hypothetical protein